MIVETHFISFLILGIILTVPLVWVLFVEIGKSIMVNFFPPKEITFEIKLTSGRIVRKRISLEDNEALIDVILSKNGRVIS